MAGASPQIVTETVYALLPEDPPRTEIHVLTTSCGREALLEGLLGRSGQWTRLLAEYPAARRFDLTERNIVVLRDARGKPLRDVRSSRDNEIAADHIVQFVAGLTGDGAPPLHASIAGGRKTMGYLLAAAMMFYGRPQDRLSHVLVRPAVLEGTDFYFIPRNPPGILVHRRPDGTAIRVRRREVRIELAYLPFPRLRALRDVGRVRERPFSAVVEELQEDLRLLIEPYVVVDAARGVLSCGGREVPLPPLRLALYSLLAERRRNGCGDKACSGCARCFVAAAEVAGPFARQLRRRVERRGSWGGGKGWSQSDFRSHVSKINAALRRALRGGAAAYEVVGKGPRGSRIYGITLSPERVRIATA